METDALPPGRRATFLGSIVLVAALLTFFSIKIVIADYYAAKQTPEGLARAAYLEPTNAKYPSLMAHYWLYSVDRYDAQAAIASYRRALTLDPHSAKTWMDLGAAYEEAGQTGAAREAYAEALKAYPISADVAWRTGNFLLRQGEFPEAFANIRRALEADPTFGEAAIITCWRAYPEIDVILDRALPPSRSIYLSSIRYLTRAHADDAALTVWDRLVRLNTKIELPVSFDLIEDLVKKNRIAEAKRVWKQALDRSGALLGGMDEDSLVWDGGFESDFVNGGFGWRKTEAPGVQYEFDREIKHSGGQSLKVIFDGRENLNWDNLSQNVPIEPNTAYEFSAYVRSEGITTNSGPLFLIFDPGNTTPKLYSTEQVRGTLPWTRLELVFTTGPKSNLVFLALRRSPSEKIDNKLAGTIWIDDVSLKPIGQKGPGQ
jgi:hypothetical protein